jgi:hypothetical protein
MRAFNPALFVVSAVLALLVLAGAAASARGDIRIGDLDIFLNDHEVTVHVVALGAIPTTFQEGLQSGIPAHVRYTVELWQYNRLWRDSLLLTKVLERQLTYNVVTKEYKVAFLNGETRAPYATREIRDAQRVLSEIHSVKLTPAIALDPAEVFYVRVSAVAALNGENTLMARMAGTAEETSRRSDYRTIMRAQ